MNHNDHTAKHGPAGRQAAKTPSDKQLEAMARGYCEALRLDPDELVQHRHEDAMTVRGGEKPIQ